MHRFAFFFAAFLLSSSPASIHLRIIHLESNSMSEPSSLQISRLQPAHVSACIDIIYTCFSDDPYAWSRPLGTFSNLRAWLEDAYVMDRAKCELPASLVACAPSNGDSPTKSEPQLEFSQEQQQNLPVAGVCTLEDFNYPPDEHQPIDPNGANAIDAILDACKVMFWNKVAERGLSISQTNSGHISYVAIVVVDPVFRRRRVGDALVERANHQLKEQGFQHAIAFCTSFRSRALFERRGYEYLGGISYQDFKMPDGSIPFATLPQDECSILYLNLLNVSSPPSS